MLTMRRSGLVGLVLLSVVAACSSSETRRESAKASGAASGTSVVSSATDESGRTENATPDAPGTRSGEASSGARPTPVAPGSVAPRDVHADRERVIEQAADEDRPSGGAEARIEPDQPVYKPGAGVLPRYSVRTIDKKDGGPEPDSGIMKFVPGSKIDLPPPAAKPPEKIDGKDEPGQSILVPREVK
jgi:hypothetical protein